MKNCVRKITSVILSLVMVVGIFPYMVLADEADVSPCAVYCDEHLLMATEEITTLADVSAETHTYTYRCLYTCAKCPYQYNDTRTLISYHVFEPISVLRDVCKVCGYERWK